MRRVGIGLVGRGGHQLTPDEIARHGGVLMGDVETPGELGTLLDDDRVELVSVCLSPRSAQVDVAVAALDAGRHVLIERPAATSKADLTRLLDAAQRTAAVLCERATTPFDQPYRLARDLLADGAVGQVVLVLAHKSYPWAEWRAVDESIAGGLVLQAAVYGLDGIQHVAGQTVASLQLVDTTLGNPGEGDQRMAASLVATLDGGGVASVAADYLNPPDSGAWGRDVLLVLGTEGRLSVDTTQLEVEVVRKGDVRTHSCPPSAPLLAELVALLAEGRPMSPAPEELISSTRLAIEALDTRISWSGGAWQP